MKGYSMPAEWSPHAATLIVLPHCSFTFRVDKAQEEFLQLAYAIATEGDEPVVLFCPTQEQADQIQQLQVVQGPSKMIHVRVCPTDDSWARDMGPTFVVASTTTTDSRKIIGSDFEFNAWGGPSEGCYWPCENDKLAPPRMCQELNELFGYQETNDADYLTTHKIPLVLEGGSIHIDGQGTILTTKECLLNPNRNPTKTQAEIETIVLEALGATKMIWLPFGVDGDEDTNGHVDNWACFAKPGHVVLSWTDDQEHDLVNYERCRQALQLLESETDAQGRSLTVHKLQLPPPMFYTQEQVESLALYKGDLPRHVGERMAGSYVNFYICNKAVIVPQFGFEDTDQQAIQTLSQLFPDRKVVGVFSKEILIGGGNLHCITQQLPKV